MKSLVLAGLVVTSLYAQALPLGEVPVPVVIQGQQLIVPTALDLAISTVSQGMRVGVLAKANLHDFQRRFDTIVKSFPLPRDNCPNYGRNILPTLEKIALAGVGLQAKVTVTGKAAVWDCQQGPAGSPPIAKRFLEEGFVGELPFSLASPDGKNIELVPGAPNISPRSGLSKFVNLLAMVVNRDLNSLAKAELDKLVNTGFFRKSLPPGYEDLNPTIEQVGFSSDPSGNLFTNVQFSATVPPEKLSAFLNRALANSRGSLLQNLFKAYKDAIALPLR